jgi:hypothetical protein
VAIDREPLPAATATAAAAAPAPEEPGRRPWPDVSEQKTVLLSPDGDKLRLLRSRRFNQLQISPDGALPDWTGERLKADGWRDRVEDEGIYTKQLPPRAKSAEDGRSAGPAQPAWTAVIEVERFIVQLANEIRAERGMTPVCLGTAAGP